MRVSVKAESIYEFGLLLLWSLFPAPGHLLCLAGALAGPVFYAFFSHYLASQTCLWDNGTYGYFSGDFFPSLQIRWILLF
jgi:hypothetical protein